ncbi:MAG TPA: hypothetical protein VLT59_02005 [Steroidobacteraceae bacterium]|nr:hypothetical protein [Steroidobacteraceae bacterium]
MQARPFRTTVIGGLIFLIPFGALLVVFGKVYAIMQQVAIPLSRWVPVERIGGIAVANLIALLLIALLCYLAGLLALTSRARNAYRKLDESLLNVFPRYLFLKSMAQGLDGDELAKMLTPVLVQFDDLAQVAFEVERNAEHVVVYLPGSPDPWSGSTAIVTAERVRPLHVELAQAVRVERAAGRGALRLMTGT